MIARRTFLAGTGAVLLAAPLAARAQQAGKVARVGFLGTVLTPTLEAFTDGLRQLGWVEGQNLVLERRFSEGRQERFRELAAELVRLKVDVIVTGGTPASMAAKEATTTIPIVMATVIDPVGTGLVASLAQPGGNITGNSWLGPELSAKRLELLKEAVPRVSRVATIFNPTNPSHSIALRDMQTTAQRLGVTLQLQQITSPDDFDQAFATIIRNRPDALFTVADPLYFPERMRMRILEFAAKRRLPAMYEWRESVESGGLMAYGVNVKDLLRRAAAFTGLTLEPGLQIGEKQLELLNETVPHLSRVLVLSNPANRAHALMSDTLRSPARSFGVQLHVVETRSPDEMDRALQAATKVKPGALLVQSDAMLFGQRRRICELAAKSRLPAIYPWRDAVEIGGFIAYGASLSGNFRRAASYVDRILKGARPADLPVEQPTKFELVINLKTAKALGLTIPPSVLNRADHVIE